MWIKNIKSFLSILKRNKLYTLVTIFGFAVSLTFVILLSVYIHNELSVNGQQPNKDRIFRLSNESASQAAPVVAEWLQGEIPEIESYTRIYNNTGIIEDKEHNKTRMEYMMGDSTFFNIFSFHFIEGNPKTALETKNSIVLTKSFARKIFRDESPIGKELLIDMEIPCTVTGVIDDISKESHFEKCDAILNFRLLADIWGWDELLTSYNNCSFGIYFLARPNTDLRAKAPKVLEMFKEHYWLYKNDRVKTVDFLPLEEVYFSESWGRSERHNSKKFVLILLAIVILILILAIINYINLTIAQSGMRVKEIAIKKLLGSSRSRLLWQQVVESILITLIAFSFAILFSFSVENTFNDLLDTNLYLSKMINSKTLLIGIGVVLFIGFISGVFPALISTRLNAISVIKGDFRRKSKALYSRVLVGFQYVVVMVLLISTMIIMKQTNFLLNRDLGFNTQNIVQVGAYIEKEKYDGFRNAVMQISGVKNVSFTAGTPTDGGNNQSFVYNGKPVSFQEFIVDSNFFEMLGIKVIPTATAYSKNGIWINKAAVKVLELDSLPKSCKIYDEDTPVLGVVNDFHFRSLYTKVGPLMIRQLNKNRSAWTILIQMEGSNTSATLQKVKDTYAEFTGGIPANFSYFDERIKSWYEKEEKNGAIVGYFALLTIIISIMGIFAISLYYNQQKTKEIGIRRVNGASVKDILRLQTKDFVQWVIIAFVIATPIAYYAMNKWLEGFAYKTVISWWIFLFAGVLTLLIVLITVSWHTFIAARRNPVEALRYE